MSKMKAMLFATALLFAAHKTDAQKHYNAWLRATLSIPFHDKWKADGEFQHRRQNGVDNNDLMRNNLMFSFRSWVHYQHSEDVRFSISPFAYFTHYRIIQNEKDLAIEPNCEIRFTAAVDLQHEIFKKLFVVDRNALEQRLLENNSSALTRLRNKLGLRYDFNEKIKLTVYDELLLNIHGTSVHHFFDHDRLGLNLEYKIAPHLKCDIGYLHITRLPAADNHKIHEDNIVLNLTCQL